VPIYQGDINYNNKEITYNSNNKNNFFSSNNLNSQDYKAFNNNSENQPNQNLKEENTLLEETNKKLNDKVIKLAQQASLLQSTIVDIVKERDFFYSKLRDIEMLLYKKT